MIDKLRFFRSIFVLGAASLLLILSLPAVASTAAVNKAAGGLVAEKSAGLDPKAYFVKAKTYYMNREYRQAISKLKMVVARDPSNTEAYLLLGSSYHNLKVLDRAVDTYLELLSRDKTESRAYLQLGLVLAERGYNDKALFNFEEAYKHNAESQVIRFQLGKMLAFFDRNIEAKEHFAWLIAGKAKFPSLAENYLATAYYTRDAELCKEVLADILKPCPEEKRIKFIYDRALGYLKVKQHRIGDALIAVGLMQYPKASSLFYLGGKTATQNGKFDTAYKLFGKALKLDPKNALLYNELGYLYILWDKKDKAAAAFISAVQQDDKYYSPHQNLGVLLLSSDQAKSKEYLTRAVSLRPKASFPHLILGLLAEKNQESEVAKEHYQSFRTYNKMDEERKNQLLFKWRAEIFGAPTFDSTAN